MGFDWQQLLEWVYWQRVLACSCTAPAVRDGALESDVDATSKNTRGGSWSSSSNGGSLENQVLPPMKDAGVVRSCHTEQNSTPLPPLADGFNYNAAAARPKRTSLPPMKDAGCPATDTSFQFHSSALPPVRNLTPRLPDRFDTPPDSKYTSLTEANVSSLEAQQQPSVAQDLPDSDDQRWI